MSALQEAGGNAISLQNYLELHLGCHACRLSYFQIGYACGAHGRAGGRAGVRSRDYQNFLDGYMITKFSYPW